MRLHSMAPSSSLVIPPAPEPSRSASCREIPGAASPTTTRLPRSYSAGPKPAPAWLTLLTKTNRQNVRRPLLPPPGPLQIRPLKKAPCPPAYSTAKGRPNPPPRILQSCARHYPLPANYREQWAVPNLYPLLIHFNLFGIRPSTRVTGYLRNILHNIQDF